MSLPHRRFLRATQTRRAASWKWSGLLGLLPLLTALALIPPLLLIWFHLADLHYLEIMPLSVGGAASLGSVLLFGLVMLTFTALCLVLPSLLIALAAAPYGQGNVPRAVAVAWAATSGILVVVWFISAHRPSFYSAFMFWPAHLAAGVFVGICALCAAYPRRHGGRERPTETVAAAFLKNPLIVGSGASVCGLIAFSTLILTIRFLAQDFLVGPLPDWGKTALPLLIAFIVSLGPGLAYLWANRVGSAGMNKSGLAVLMLMAAFVMFMISYSAWREVRHQTLIASGIVGNPTSPQLYRLPDSWNTQDEQIVADAFAPKPCELGSKQHPAGDVSPARWICGYQNFSFGRARLICNHPYMDAHHQFTNEELICLLYIDNTLASLVTLRPPGSGKSAEKATKTAPADGSL